MSLVQFAFTHDFILVGGDTRGTDINQNIVCERFNKVIKINKRIIMGVSGKAQDAYLLLEKYCDFSEKQGFTLKNNNYILSYNNVNQELTSRFKELLKVHSNKENDIYFNFTVVICGYDGCDFVATQYTMSNDVINKPIGIFPIEISKKSGVRNFVIGTDEYLEIHNNNNWKELRENQPSNILQYKNVMRNVLEKGAKFDKTINNSIKFEQIRKVDIL